MTKKELDRSGDLGFFKKNQKNANGKIQNSDNLIRDKM